MSRKRGFTLIELLVVIAIIALLVGLLLPALAKAKRNAATLKDAAQIKQIHQAMMVWGNDHDDQLPLPGKINRLRDIYLQQESIGVGPEDTVKNTSANLYSAMIAQNFFNPDILISPTEVNPFIRQYQNYQYSAYDPGIDSYWDGDTSDPDQSENFSADISGAAGTEGNTSYYHLALIGIRKKINWRTSAQNNDPLMASRAPEEGLGEETDEYKKSQTLLMHGTKQAWVGNVCYGDNHCEIAESFYPGLVSYEPAEDGGQLTKDNIFQPEFRDYDDTNGHMSGDAYLGMTETMSDTAATMYVEELLP